MEENELKKLLQKAAQGKATEQETHLLDRLISERLKSSSINTFDTQSAKQRVLKNTMANIKFKKRRQSIQSFMKYAAVLVLCLTVGFIYFNKSFSNTEQQAESFVEVYTKPGERKTIMLPDHTTLVLNANSYCKYPNKFPDNKREINLKGEAFFNVHHDKSKPFVVKTNDLNITVLGTSFNIKEDSLNVSVTVSTGCVRVDQANQETEAAILVKDKQYTLDLKTNKSQVFSANSEYISDWSRNIIRFENSTLKEVINTLESWYGVKIDNQSPRLSERTLNGKYQNKSIDYVLEDLKFMLDLNYQKHGNNIILTQ